MVSLKAMWSAFAPMIIITAIVAVIGKFKAMYDEAKRIKNIFSDYKKGAESVVNATEISALNTQLQIMNDKKQSQENINSAQAQLQKMLNAEGKSQKELNELVAKRVKLLENSAKVDYYSRKKIEAQEQYNGLNDKHSKLKAKTMNGGFFTRLWNGTEVGDTRKEMDELLRIITDSTREIAKATVETNKLSTIDPPGGVNPDDKKSALQKAEEEYANKLKEYSYQRDNGALKEQEYYKAVDELNKATYKKIGGLLTPEKALLNETFAKSMIGSYNPLYNEAKEKIAEELEKVEAEYADAVELAKVKLNKKLISEDDYREAIIDAAMSAADSAISIKGIGDAANGFIQKVQSVAISEIEKPVLGKRDSAFDYKKSDTDKISGELDVWKKYKEELEDLKRKHKGLSEELQLELTNAIKKVPTLEEALKIAEIKEDVKQFSRDLSEGIYSGIKDVASSADRLVSAFQNLDEVFDPESEASGWERLMAVWSAMTNVVDSFLSICKMVESLTELTNKLAIAQQTEAAVNTATTATKVTNANVGAMAAVTASGTTAIAATTEVAANTAKGVSAAGASAAGLPFPANLVAIGAAIAAAVGLFASIPKFATGGVVGGNSPSGDKILARLNSGELILNKGQQSKLSDAIDSQREGSGNGGVVVSGTSRVKGDDIYLSLSNHVKRTGKKSPWK